MSAIATLTRAAALGLAVLSGAPAGAEPVTMTSKLANGDRGVYSFVSDNEQIANVTGEPDKKITSKTRMWLHLAISDATADQATVSATYDRIAIRVDSPGLTSEFDSDWPGNRDGDSIFAPAVRTAANKPLTATISPKDGVGEMQGVDQIAQPGPVGDPARQLLNPVGLREQIAKIFGVKPAPAPRNIGDTWTIENVMPNQVGVVKFVETYKLTKVEGGKASIAISAVGALERKKEGLPAGAEFVSIQDATISGEAVWDLSAAQLEHLAQTLTMVVVDTNPTYNGKKVTQTVTTKTTLDKAK